MPKIYLVIVTILFLASCKKSDLEVVPANEPPPDNTVSDVTVENYITRTYILVLGREPGNMEFTQAHDMLTAGKLDSASRWNFVASVFEDYDYLINVYNQNRVDLLNNVDTAEFTQSILIYTYYLADSSQILLWPALQYQLDRMVLMRNAFGQFLAGTIQVDELHRRMCNNDIYDQLNMGSANFVISTFQHLINRNPTVAEQQSGVSMVDGNYATLFLQSGASKEDYLNIFLHSANYFEGQVILLYSKYLNRVPTTLEMADGASKYSSTHDYTLVQKQILTSDEFIGL
jgi:hypothetical protein